MNTIIDLRILDDHPEALAKIAEALAKVYFDNVLNKKFDIKPIGDAYTKAFNLCPNYRLILQNKPGFEKYKDLKPLFAEITSLPIGVYEFPISVNPLFPPDTFALIKPKELLQ